MDNKTLSITSYITLIGWLVAYIMGKDKADDLLKYHLRQSLGLIICAFIFNAIIGILVVIVPTFGLLSYLGIIFLILMILGAINASNAVKKPLPFLGEFFEDKFSFID